MLKPYKGSTRLLNFKLESLLQHLHMYALVLLKAVCETRARFNQTFKNRNHTVTYPDAGLHLLYCRAASERPVKER
jgi:hypothetical protein